MIKQAGKAGLLLFVEIGLAIIFLIVIIVGMFLFQYTANKVQFSYKNIERSFRDNTSSFTTLAEFISQEDLSLYQHDGSADVPYITIAKPKSLPEDSIYMYSVTAESVSTHEIPDLKANAAIGDLFRNTDLFYIRQTKSSESRSIYLLFSALAGLVFSPSGDIPTDGFDYSMIYTYERIDDHWFYWTGVWSD
jgi:hypothetical protein